MVEIFIDDQRCDVEVGFQPEQSLFTFDAEAFRNLDSARTGRSTVLRLPFSAENDRIMGFAADPTAGTPFNADHHTGRIVVDGVELLAGMATLLSVEGEDGSGFYSVSIRDGAGDWIDTLATRRMIETDLDFAATLDYAFIEQSWQGEQTVRLLPVCHDDYREPYDSTSLYAPQRVMTTSDYHPFISVERMLRAIFEGVCYTVESRFLQSELAKKLHFSGCYPSAGASLTRLDNSSGFKAGRVSEATATADAMGRVWMTPLVLTSSIGNFVETTDGGELYNNRDVLQITNEGTEYHPSVEVSVSWEIFLKYTTDFSMVSSSRLQGFDALYVDTGCDMAIPLANPYKDRRASVTAGVQYKCMIFDFASGETYRLVYRTADGDSLLKSITAEQTSFTMPSLSGGECVLLDSEGEEYAGDWAIYDGYVERTGTTDVEITLLTPPERLTPTKGKSFTKMYLHGATQGQRLTLSSQCTLRPLFSSAPALGSTLTGKSILNHDATQLEFVEALQQMFNLRIATCEQSRRVYIEPYDDFYDGELRDVSIYADRKADMRASDLATEHRKRFSLCYRAEGDGAVARHNAQSGETFGEWSASLPSYAAKMGRQRSANTLFYPTISAAGIHASAPSALIMQVGDRDADEVEQVSMRIVSYEGMRALPESERWGAPSFGGEYPLAAFHAPEQFTLCFEDRDGVQGLHRYYDREWKERSLRRRLALTLTLPPHALPMLTDASEGGGARDIYRLNVAGQRASYYLSRIAGYDTATHSARCEMIRTAED